MSKLFTVSPSPHNYGKDTVRSLMYGVIIALIPTLAISLYFFGLGALIVTLVSVVSALIFEYLITKFLLKKQPDILDGSALITGLLLAFNVPSNLPIIIIIIGALVAIGIGKMTFGGLGNNPFNPALVGRVFLLISFPVQMTSWPLPIQSRMHYLDAMTGATPLGIVKEGIKNGEKVSDLMSQIPSHMQLFIGNMGGSLGEVAGIAILLGLAWLLYKKVITWHIPISMIGTIVIFTGILWLINPDKYLDPLFHVLTGGVLLGAVFMATDYVTSPMTHKGMIIFGIGIGFLTVIIRIFGAYPEGVSFAILIMNAFVPLINMYVKPKRFGEVINNG
ncbi:MAG: RnfABCDGE type electron transport complex subunit D [Bacteroidales bacterium]|nr:RnfABCDGE type electron transport complex subunit D [Bacteroidales bacterium]MBN2757623.1 RnfABCDGE type electron transport complex subunit D [Bacteroidales bacterium]